MRKLMLSLLILFAIHLNGRSVFAYDARPSRTLVMNLPAGDPQDAAYQEYKTAYNFVLDQRWAEAITRLEAYINKYPNNQYTDDANFWLCYSREKRGDNADAVYQAYEKFVEKFSRSQYVNDARSNI